MPSENERITKRPFKIKSILLTVFILIPLAIMTLLYFASDTFRDKANGVLKNAPIIGGIISKYPTKTEVNDKELSIARYYIEELDKESAADKLYIIKKDDAKVYDTIIKKMNTVSSKKTQDIVKEIRNLELRKDLVSTLYEEIQTEKDKKVKAKASNLESMGTRAAIHEIMDRTSIEEGELEKIFTYLSNNAAVEILHYIDGGTRSEIMYKLSNIDMKRKNELQGLLNEKRRKEEELEISAQNLAKVYGVKDPIKASEEIANTEKLSMDVLTRLYMNLDPKKSAEILVHSKDEKFNNELFESIISLEELRGVDQSVTVDITNVMNFLQDYNKKIDDLVVLYEKMTPDNAAKAIEKLLENKQEVTVFSIKEESGYKLSDHKIAMEILKKMKKPKVSKILGNLEPAKVAQITRVLAIE
ncbi:hypothetical protein CLPU_5c01220 [Gottschalkia purinilytica]|uniref:Uncharacterized protein n=1 Tax=Gottschalkia purinilytica TaxID=1503 RepID=A0A0L0WBS7_GOTPU|nr:hypothetical protein [Gottschalkia purinilytica]KNF08815.1 hypothetical protein CLPU_5c01220 [Gottschalkia purinilytica]